MVPIFFLFPLSQYFSEIAQNPVTNQPSPNQQHAVICPETVSKANRRFEVDDTHTYYYPSSPRFEYQNQPPTSLQDERHNLQLTNAESEPVYAVPAVLRDSNDRRETGGVYDKRVPTTATVELGRSSSTSLDENLLSR